MYLHRYLAKSLGTYCLGHLPSYTHRYLPRYYELGTYIDTYLGTLDWAIWPSIFSPPCYTSSFVGNRALHLFDWLICQNLIHLAHTTIAVRKVFVFIFILFWVCGLRVAFWQCRYVVMELLALKCKLISLGAFRISVLCETKLTTWMCYGVYCLLRGVALRAVQKYCLVVRPRHLSCSGLFHKMFLRWAW